MLIASHRQRLRAGFHTWHKLGRFVKKGEEHLQFSLPIVRPKSQSVEQNETDESSTAVGFRAAYVFDISQTDGQELTKSATSMVIPANTASGSVNSLLNKAFFSNTRRTSPLLAALPRRRQDHVAAGPGSIIRHASAHEVAHELMHRDERRASLPKRNRETKRASSIRYAKQSGLRQDRQRRLHQLYEGDRQLLSESLQHVQQTANRILNAIGAEESSAPPV